MNEKEGIPKLNWMLYFYSMSKILDWNSTPTNLWLTILKFYTKKMVAHTPGAHQHEGQSDHHRMNGVMKTAHNWGHSTCL